MGISLHVLYRQGVIDKRCSSASDTIGKRVKALRLAKSWTLAETGEAVGRLLGATVTPQAIWQAEHGQRDWKAAQVVAFAIAFEVPVGDLFEKLPYAARNPVSPLSVHVTVCRQCGKPWPCSEVIS